MSPARPHGPSSPVVHGPIVDEHTRCIHYRTDLDIVAIRAACCDTYFPCHLCHDQTADHPLRPWPAGSSDEHAVLCGACWTELTIAAYTSTDACPRCGSGFNPRCALHHPVYFG